MKKKKTALLAGLLGAGVLTASAQFYRKIQEDRKKAQALQEVRDFFADLGEIPRSMWMKRLLRRPLLSEGL
ncbi:DUF4651 domain-containing protein [Streptococcus suis]|nr:DUF4651 domain-containing protein [Streptococcus suis]MCH1665104.1 DUF4651 domain-containing protein [Streptococcus suis]